MVDFHRLAFVASSQTETGAFNRSPEAKRSERILFPLLLRFFLFCVPAGKYALHETESVVERDYLRTHSFCRFSIFSPFSFSPILPCFHGCLDGILPISSFVLRRFLSFFSLFVILSSWFPHFSIFSRPLFPHTFIPCC